MTRQIDVEHAALRYGELGPGEIRGIRRELNVRELGGYAVADGRRVKRGMIARGSRLADLDACELGRLEQLGIRTVLDLRAESEAADAPDSALAGARNVRIAGMYFPGTADEVDFSPQQMARFMELGKRAGDLPGGMRASGDDVQAMHELYLSMPFGNPGMHAVFDLLERGEAPLYIHCTAGKDRTGMAAMLVLLALGASREDTLYDFALTNRYRASLIEQFVAKSAEVVAEHPEKEWEIRMRYGVSLDYGADLLDCIVERHGSFEAYFEAEFGLDAEGIARLRDRYTE